MHPLMVFLTVETSFLGFGEGQNLMGPKNMQSKSERFSGFQEQAEKIPRASRDPKNRQRKS